MTRVFILALMLLLAGCTGGATLQEGDTFAYETVPLDASPSAQSFIPEVDGPLRALSASPYGPLLSLADDQVISVTFTRPMVPLGKADPPPEGSIVVRPGVEGRVYWDGSQTLVLEPARPLTPATAYEVTVSSGMTSIDGEQLAEPIRWTFETPRPRVEWSEPQRNEPYADPDGPLRLGFNQAVRASGAGDRIQLHGTGRGRVDVRVAAAGDSTLIVQPTGRLQPGSAYELILLPGIRPQLGSLASSDTVRIPFQTYGPLRFQRIDQERPWQERDRTDMNPARAIILSFSTPVRFGDLRRALSFSPEVELPIGIEARDGIVSTHHSLTLPLEPETRYRVSVRALRDQFDQVLSEGAATFRTRAYDPMVRMPEGMLVIEAGQDRALPLHATNIASVQFGAVRLDAQEVIPAIRSYDRHRYYGEGEREHRDTAVEASRTLPLGLERNRMGTVPLRLDSLLRGGRGFVGTVVDVSGVGEDGGRRQFRALAQVTNLGVSAKFSAHQNLIIITDLATAQPVSGARVTIRDIDNRVRWEGRTDSGGRAETPGWARLGMRQLSEWEAPTQFVFVEHQGDEAFSSSRYNEGIEPWRFQMPFSWWPEAEVFDGSVFTDRGLYRAGEYVHVKGILRKKTDRDWSPVTDSIRVFIVSSREQVVFDGGIRPSELGTFDFDWTAPEGADQGAYLVRIALASDTAAASRDSWQRGDVARGHFQVDSFRRASFSVVSRLLSSGYVAGDFLEGTISGHYLFGAAMAGQPLRYSLNIRPTTYTPPGYDGYRFGGFESDEALYRQLTAGEDHLDANGAYAVRVQLPGNATGTPVTATLGATVTDPARQDGSGYTDVLVHPAAFYIGLKPATTFLDLSRSQTMTADLVAVDPAGASLGERPVTLELIRRQWDSVREEGVDGRLRWRSRLVEDVLGTQRLSSVAGRAVRVHMPVTQGGSYVLRGTARDIRGNTVRTDAYFYATGEGYVAWERSDDDRIDLIPERTDYRPGETARLMVQSPFEEATALVTVEREGIISSRVETLRGSAPQIEIPLTDEHLPNVFVSVMLLSGRMAEPGARHDTGAPSFKIGYAQLRVDPGVRHLQVEVTPDRSEYRPGDEIVVQLRVRDARGRGTPAEVTFSAADAGVLNLIGYALPDPFDAFYGERPLGVTTTDSRSNLLKQRDFGQKVEDAGGGGGNDRDERIRRDFRPQAHWAPSIRTDGSGRATIRFRLPESTTTFRLMATAVASGNRFGTGRSDILLTQPLVIQPALARFVRLGDRFEAGVLITNMTGDGGEATVTAGASGLTLLGGGSRKVTLEPGQTQEVRFAWSADVVGTAVLSFDAQLGRERDAFEIGLPVALPASKQVAGTFAATENTARESIYVPEDAIAALGRLDIRLSSTALVGLDGAARYLFEYPYGCLEQTTSRIRPLIAGTDLIRAFDLDALDGNHRQVVQNWITRLPRFWTGQGFATWEGGSYVNPYVTAYVVQAMADARDSGYAIPEQLHRDAAERLSEWVRNRSERPSYMSDAVWDDTRAMMLWALARSGTVLEGEIATLAGAFAASPGRSVEATSHLLRTIVLADRMALNRYRGPLAERLRRAVQVESTTAYLSAPSDNRYQWIYASDVRSTAYGLAALVAHDASPDVRALGMRMIRYLMQQRSGPSWATTQDNAMVIEALGAYFRAFEVDEPSFTAEVRLGGQRLMQEQFSSRSLTMREASRAVAELPAGEQAPIVVSKTGAGTLYYALSLETWSAAPQEAARHGLAVERRIQRLDPSGAPRGERMAVGGGVVELEPGDLVQVTLRVQSPVDRHYVVVDDALPAGLEAVNASFQTSARYDAARGDEIWWGSFNHLEMRDDRVLLFADYMNRGEHTYTYLARATTPGTFTYPPARAEMMYQPETYGQTATATVRVGPPMQALR